MKLFFTSLVMFCGALMASAQNFTVSSSHGPVANGATIDCGYFEDDGEFIWDPELKLQTNKAGTYSVTASASVPDVVQFCGLAEQCKMLSAEPFTRSKEYSADRTVLMQIDMERYEKITQPVVVDVTVTDGTETVSFTVNFLTTENAGINAVKVPAGNLSFSGRNLSYNLSSPESFTLYNIGGRQVYNRVLSTNGNIYLGNIPAGVYVYRCGNQTGKVIIK